MAILYEKVELTPPLLGKRSKISKLFKKSVSNGAWQLKNDFSGQQPCILMFKVISSALTDYVCMYPCTYHFLNTIKVNTALGR